MAAEGMARSEDCGIASAVRTTSLVPTESVFLLLRKYLCASGDTSAAPAVQEEDAGGRPVRGVIGAMAANGEWRCSSRAKKGQDLRRRGAFFFFFLSFSTGFPSFLLKSGSPIGNRGRTAPNILFRGLAPIDERSCRKGTVEWREVFIKIGLLSRSRHFHRQVQYCRCHRTGSTSQTASGAMNTPTYSPTCACQSTSS